MTGWEIVLGEGLLAGYTWAAAGDLGGAPGIEVVASLSSDLVGNASLEVRDGSGALQWTRQFQEQSAGNPLLADLDGDGLRDVFVAGGRIQNAFHGDGSLLWEVEARQETGHTVSFPLALDLDQDGAFDVLQMGRLPEPEDLVPGPLNVPKPVREAIGEPQGPVLWGMDGRSGQVMFEHELPCGTHGTQPIGVMRSGEPLVVVGCVFSGGRDYGTPGSTLQALRVRPAQTRLGALLADLELRPPFETEILWSYEIQGGDVYLVEALAANVLGSEDPEIVALWLDRERIKSFGVTALSTDGKLLFEHVIPINGVRGVLTPAAADLDGDGDDELAFVDSRGLHVFDVTLAGITELWRAPSAAEAENGFQSSPAGVAFADLDADGTPEVIAGYQGSVGSPPSVRFYDADGVVLWAQDYPGLPAQATPIRSPLVADLDLDGSLEIVYAANERLILFHASG